MFNIAKHICIFYNLFTFNMKLEDKIKRIRKKNKLSQSQFSNIIGCTRQAISNIELGNNPPSLKFLLSLSEKFNINLNWLLRDIGNMELTEYENTMHLQEKVQFLEKEINVYREILDLNQLIKNKKKK